MRKNAVMLGALIALALTGCDNPFSSKVECDEISSAEWRSDPEARTYEFAEAIRRCGALDGKSRAGIEAWMGKSEFNEGKGYMGWHLGAEVEEDSLNSERPMISISKDGNGRFTRFFIFKP